MNKRKRDCFAIISLSLFSISTPNFITSCSTINKIENDDKTPINNDYLNSDDFFPKIYKEDYYDYVEFKNHQPYVGTKFKMRLIKDVVSRVSNSKGKISFFVEDNQENKDINNKNVKFHFRWNYNKYDLYKTYVINFTNN